MPFWYSLKPTWHNPKRSQWEGISHPSHFLFIGGKLMNITRETNDKNTDELNRGESPLPNAEATAQPVRQYVDIHIYNEYPEDEDAQGIEETTGTIETT